MRLPKLITFCLLLCSIFILMHSDNVEVELNNNLQALDRDSLNDSINQSSNTIEKMIELSSYFFVIFTVFLALFSLLTAYNLSKINKTIKLKVVEEFNKKMQIMNYSSKFATENTNCIIKTLENFLNIFETSLSNKGDFQTKDLGILKGIVNDLREEINLRKNHMQLFSVDSESLDVILNNIQGIRSKRSISVLKDFKEYVKITDIENKNDLSKRTSKLIKILEK